MRAGVIVAGGHSTRFGEADKVVADLAGTPMVRRVADRLTTVVDELVVNCRADQVAAIDAALSGVAADEVRFAEDSEEDLGPMAGIHAGLSSTESAYAAVVAADMPFVDPAFLASLFDRAAGHDAAVVKLDDGWYQTTQAVYRTGAMAEACATALARNKRKIIDPLFELDYVVVSEEEVREQYGLETFENLNTREEFEAAAAEFVTTGTGSVEPTDDSAKTDER